LVLKQKAAKAAFFLLFHNPKIVIAGSTRNPMNYASIVGDCGAEAAMTAVVFSIVP